MKNYLQDLARKARERATAAAIESARASAEVQTLEEVLVQAQLEEQAASVGTVKNNFYIRATSLSALVRLNASNKTFTAHDFVEALAELGVSSSLANAKAKLEVYRSKGIVKIIAPGKFNVDMSVIRLVGVKVGKQQAASKEEEGHVADK